MNGLIREPRQTRSRARVDRMIDAAAKLLDTEGLDGVTTTAVADGAGVSIGSYYQFFADRNGVLTALAARDRARIVTDLEKAGVDAELVTAALDREPVGALIAYVTLRRVWEVMAA